MSKSLELDFAFFTVLHRFYEENKGTVKKSYRALTKKFLDFNDPENNGAFLRKPQYEALEIYIFLKEFLDNESVHELFHDWYHKIDKFQGRTENSSISGRSQMSFLHTLELQDKDEYEKLFKSIKRFARSYPNYIFALTMGTGKTILMATCIFYEFILANKFPKDEKYCHNALVFAPDKTVLQSLREIQTFDMSLVVPPEYASFLQAHIQFHFLDDTGITLNTMDQSMFNVVISNTQKIILKKKHKKATAMDKLFSMSASLGQGDTVYDQYADLYDFDKPETEAELTLNQRFHKLTRLKQLGIYVDEAHHAFGTKLAKDMGMKKSDTSLRVTIDELALNLKKAGTRVVACYNYTGTPYVGRVVLPEVVYAYGLKEAIDKQYLKQVEIESYDNAKSKEYLREVIKDFWEKEGKNRREGMLPKLAFFAATVEELTQDVRPAIEEILTEMGVSTSKILVNVGDPRVTTNDDIREFNNLDTPKSEKQFILLVNKGREGWNCRSLFGVSLYRKPKSKVFVLQATMRCLRSIGDTQETGRIYLSEDNLKILDDELQQNFRLSTDDINKKKSESQPYEIRLVPPPVKIKLMRTKRLYNIKKRDFEDQIDFETNQIDLDKYRILKTSYKGLEGKKVIRKEEITHIKEQRVYSNFTLIAEIARYFNDSDLGCLSLEKLLSNSKQGLDEICSLVNAHNEILHDHIIPKLFEIVFDIDHYKNEVEEEIELVKEPENGFYKVSANPSLVSFMDDFKEDKSSKSFHLDTYCFDSIPEKAFFSDLIHHDNVEKIYFTGMLTHGQSEFYIQYIDPESHTIKSYYPDFLVLKKDGSWSICEVKGDNKIDDNVVKAKAEYATQIASASSFTYHIIPGSVAARNQSCSFLNI